MCSGRLRESAVCSQLVLGTTLCKESLAREHRVQGLLVASHDLRDLCDKKSAHDLHPLDDVRLTFAQRLANESLSHG